MVKVYFQGINSFSMVIPALNHQWGCNRYLGNAQIGSASFYMGLPLPGYCICELVKCQTVKYFGDPFQEILVDFRASWTSQ